MEWTAFVIAPQPDVGRHDVDVERDENALPAVLQVPRHKHALPALLEGPRYAANQLIRIGVR